MNTSNYFSGRILKDYAMKRFAQLPNQNLANDSTIQENQNSHVSVQRTDSFIARFCSYWTDRTRRGLHSVPTQTVSSVIENRRDSVSDKREAPDQCESGYKRVNKKNQKPAEVFEETLRLVNEMFPERKVI